MSIIVVSDIFGLTPGLSLLAERLSKTGHKVVILDPYDGIPQNFSSEENAYAFFTQHVGIDFYAKKLNELVEQSVNLDNIGVLTLIGFSVGASAIWRISNTEVMRSVNQAFYFYGSQIRHDTEITPNLKSTLVFPKYEQHFNVDDLQKRLEIQPEVSTIRCKYLHGFMNPSSVNYNKDACSYYTDWLCNKITVM